MKQQTLNMYVGLRDGPFDYPWRKDGGEAF